LVATATRTGVEDRVFRISVKIRVTRIDSAKVGKQGNNAAVPLIDTIAYFVNFRNFGPGDYLARFETA
jgi:hypothetical protein